MCLDYNNVKIVQQLFFKRSKDKLLIAAANDVGDRRVVEAGSSARKPTDHPTKIF